MAYLKKLKFDKETDKVYCINVNGKEYANFPISFKFWLEGGGKVHCAIENGIYPIRNDTDYDLDYGRDIGDSYGTFWVALNRTNHKGFHGYAHNTNRSIDSGTYGCIRAENEDGEQICRAISEALDAGVEVVAEVVGNVDEYAKFCKDAEGEQ